MQNNNISQAGFTRKNSRYTEKSNIALGKETQETFLVTLPCTGLPSFPRKKASQLQIIMNNSTNFEGNLPTTRSASSTRVPRHLAIFVIVFVAVSILAGTFGNGGVCLLHRKRRDLRKVPHYLLANLALSGILMSLLSMPLLIFMTVVNYFQIDDSLVLEFLCKVGFVSSFACNVMNAVTLWLMAFDRQECVLRPLDRHITTSNVKKIILATWALALTTLVLFSISIRNEQSVCIEFFPFNNMLTELGHHKLFTILLSIVGQFDKITIVIMVVTFFRIVKALRSSVVNASNLTLRQRQQKKLTYLTYKMLGIFLLFRVPVIVCQTALPRIESVQERTTKTTSLVSYAMLNLVYVANPILHHKMLKIRPAKHGNATATRPAVDLELVETAVHDRENQNTSVETQSESITTAL